MGKGGRGMDPKKACLSSSSHPVAFHSLAGCFSAELTSFGHARLEVHRECNRV